MCVGGRDGKSNRRSTPVAQALRGVSDARPPEQGTEGKAENVTRQDQRPLEG